jgi:hypothetical protein
MILIGWRHDAEHHDGGVPVDVARVLAGALTLTSRVTFLSSVAGSAASDAWAPHGADQARMSVRLGPIGRVTAKLRGEPSEVALISTRQPETATRLFNDAGYPWWLQGQVILLSRVDAEPPAIDGHSVLALMEEDWASRVGDLAGHNVAGVARPGVDGDVMGVLSFTESFEVGLLTAIQRQTVQAGLGWAIVPEDEFANVLANSQ